MQSNMGFIDLLPALPDVWTDGSAEGIVTRGNFELDLAWADNTLTQAGRFWACFPPQLQNRSSLP